MINKIKSQKQNKKTNYYPKMKIKYKKLLNKLINSLQNQNKILIHMNF